MPRWFQESYESFLHKIPQWFSPLYNINCLTFFIVVVETRNFSILKCPSLSRKSQWFSSCSIPHHVPSKVAQFNWSHNIIIRSCRTVFGVHEILVECIPIKVLQLLFSFLLMTIFIEPWSPFIITGLPTLWSWIHTPLSLSLSGSQQFAYNYI